MIECTNKSQFWQVWRILRNYKGRSCFLFRKITQMKEDNPIFLQWFYQPLHTQRTATWVTAWLLGNNNMAACSSKRRAGLLIRRQRGTCIGNGLPHSISLILWIQHTRFFDTWTDNFAWTVLKVSRALVPAELIWANDICLWYFVRATQPDFRFRIWQCFSQKL